MLQLQQMMREANTLIKQARDVLESAEKEGRSLTAEDKEAYDRHFDAAMDLKERIKKAEQLRDLEAEMAGKEEERKAETGRESREEIQKRAFRRFLVEGKASLRPEEARALQVDDPEAGGYIVPPQQFVADLIQAVDDRLFVRQYARKESVPNADSLGRPSLDADPEDGTWTTEIAQVDEDTAMDFGKRELHPHPVSKLIKVSKKLLRKASNAEALVRDRLAYKLAVTEEKAFLLGTGAGQPLGVFVASADGISTGRDNQENHTTTALNMDGLIAAKYTLKSQYWPNARWLFHRDGVKRISQLKGNDTYYWQPSLQAGEPDRLLSFPVDTSEYCPNTFAASQYVGLLASWFDGYMIADSLSPMLERLVELYARNRQVGFIIEAELDGMPVLEEAFVRVQMADS